MAKFDATGRGQQRQDQQGLGPRGAAFRAAPTAQMAQGQRPQAMAQPGAKVRSAAQPSAKPKDGAGAKLKGAKSAKGKAGAQKVAPGNKHKHKKLRSSKQWRKILWKNRIAFLKCIVVIFVISVFISIGEQGYQLYRIHEQQRELEKQIVELRKENEELKKQKEDLNNLQTVESIARDQLGLVRPGEVPYVK